MKWLMARLKELMRNGSTVFLSYDIGDETVQYTLVRRHRMAKSSSLYWLMIDKTYWRPWGTGTPASLIWTSPKDCYGGHVLWKIG